MDSWAKSEHIDIFSPQVTGRPRAWARARDRVSSGLGSGLGYMLGLGLTANPHPNPNPNPNPNPQLYTSGLEAKPEYQLTPCRSGGWG